METALECAKSKSPCGGIFASIMPFRADTSANHIRKRILDENFPLTDTVTFLGDAPGSRGDAWVLHRILDVWSDGDITLCGSQLSEKDTGCGPEHQSRGLVENADPEILLRLVDCSGMNTQDQEEMRRFVWKIFSRASFTK